MTDRDDTKQRVKDATDLADWIGREVELKRNGENEWKGLCPFHKEKSPSFTVFRKDGQWTYHCFGCPATGDIFEWVMQRKGIGFLDALKLVANAANIVLPAAGDRMYQPAAVKNEDGRSKMEDGKDRGPFDPEKYRALTEGSAAFIYLTQKRMLPVDLLRDYSVGETTDGLAYSFAYKWRPQNWPDTYKLPKFEFCKVVKVERPDGKKVEWREPKGGKNILFGMMSAIVVAAHASGGELVICEGEIDAVTWAYFGFAAVSVPGGAKYMGWIDHCYEWLQAFKKIHISFDEDAAGRMKVVEIVTRLGIARTDIVRLPEKGAV